MKSLKNFFIIGAFTFFLTFLFFGVSQDANAFICDSSTECAGQPFDYGPIPGSCDGAPWGVTQCGRCYCDGVGGSYCHPTEGTACPTPTPYPTPAPGATLSFSFAPNGGSFGNVTLNETSGGVSVLITNVSSVNGASCIVTVDDDTSFDVLNGTCGTINAGASCTVIIKGHPEALGYAVGRLCIDAQGCRCVRLLRYRF